jgi:hypothetical protein
MNHELNRAEKILNINSAHVDSIPTLGNNHEIDRIMTRIRLSGGNTVEEILIAIQKIELDFPKYRDTFIYKVLRPGPPLLVKNIETKLSSNQETKRLFKALNIDLGELQWCYNYYYTSLALLVAFIITLFTGNFHLVLGSFILLSLSITWHSYWFTHTIDRTVFVKVYEQICDVLERDYQEHCNYVQKVISFPDQVTLRHQEMNKKKLFDSMQVEENRNRQDLELKQAKSLQKLAGMVAIHQATTEEEIANIRNQTKLDYLETELGIRNRIEAQKRSHESALVLLNGMAQCLIERGKSLANDDQEQRNISYQLKLVNGIRGRFQNVGADAMAEGELYESLKKMMDMMSEPISTDSV